MTGGGFEDQAREALVTHIDHVIGRERIVGWGLEKIGKGIIKGTRMAVMRVVLSGILGAVSGAGHALMDGAKGEFVPNAMDAAHLSVNKAIRLDGQNNLSTLLNWVLAPDMSHDAYRIFRNMGTGKPPMGSSRH